MFYRCALTLPSSQINLYCLSAEISKQQRYHSILHVSILLATYCTLLSDISADKDKEGRALFNTSVKHVFRKIVTTLIIKNK